MRRLYFFVLIICFIAVQNFAALGDDDKNEVLKISGVIHSVECVSDAAATIVHKKPFTVVFFKDGSFEKFNGAQKFKLQEGKNTTIKFNKFKEIIGMEIKE